MRIATTCLALALAPMTAAAQDVRESARPRTEVTAAGDTDSALAGSIRSDALESLAAQIPRPTPGPRVSLRLFGGWVYLAGGEVNRGVAGSTELSTVLLLNGINDRVQGETEPVHGGLVGGGDVVFPVTSRLGIGIGVSSISAATESAVTGSTGGASGGDTLEFSLLDAVDIRAVPIRLGVFYTRPVTRVINVVLSGGVGLYFTKFSWNSQQHRFVDGDLNRTGNVGERMT